MSEQNEPKGSGVTFELKDGKVYRRVQELPDPFLLGELQGKNHFEYADADALTYRNAVWNVFNKLNIKLVSESIKGEKRDPVSPKEPPRPPESKREGDKDLAVFDWYKRYRPKEWKIRYGILGMGSYETPQYDDNGQPIMVDGKDEYGRPTGQLVQKTVKVENVLLARRKVGGRTHVPPEGHPAWSEGYEGGLDGGESV